MISQEMEDMYQLLLTIQPPGLQRNDAKNYIAFQSDVPARKRNVNGVFSRGVTFRTEDISLLERLKESGIEWEKVLPDTGRHKSTYLFRGLTRKNVQAHLDDFRKLFDDSNRLLIQLAVRSRTP